MTVERRIELFDIDHTNGRTWRVSLVAVRPGESPLTEPTAAARLSRQQRRPMV